MSATPDVGGVNRIPTGGRIDRDQSVTLTHDGRSLAGYVGDTVASALLAHDMPLVARSFKYHRPRGIMAAGVEEPNALLTVGSGARQEPNIAATVLELHYGLHTRSQNAWPSVRFRPDGSQLAAVTVFCRRLLLQDLHGADAQGLDVLRAFHPQGSRAGRGHDPGRPGALRLATGVHRCAGGRRRTGRPECGAGRGA